MSKRLNRSLLWQYCKRKRVQRAEEAIPNPKSDTPKFPEEAIPIIPKAIPLALFPPLNLAARS